LSKSCASPVSNYVFCLFVCLFDFTRILRNISSSQTEMSGRTITPGVVSPIRSSSPQPPPTTHHVGNNAAAPASNSSGTTNTPPGEKHPQRDEAKAAMDGKPMLHQRSNSGNKLWRAVVTVATAPALIWSLGQQIQRVYDAGTPLALRESDRRRSKLCITAFGAFCGVVVAAEAWVRWGLWRTNSSRQQHQQNLTSPQ
jgi:hypothetical protein